MKNNINKIRFLIIILLIVFPVILFSQTTSDLEIKNTKPGSTEPKITITPQGDFSTTVPSQVNAITGICCHVTRRTNLEKAIEMHNDFIDKKLGASLSFNFEF